MTLAKGAPSLCGNSGESVTARPQPTGSPQSNVLLLTFTPSTPASGLCSLPLLNLPLLTHTSGSPGPPAQAASCLSMSIQHTHHSKSHSLELNGVNWKSTPSSARSLTNNTFEENVTPLFLVHLELLDLINYYWGFMILQVVSTLTSQDKVTLGYSGILLTLQI